MISFVAIMGVMLISLYFFRRRRLGTPLRILLAAVAIFLLVVSQRQAQDLTFGRWVLIGFATFVLGAGIWYLYRFERDVQEK